MRPASPRPRRPLLPICRAACSSRGRARRWSTLFQFAPLTWYKRALAPSAASNAAGSSLHVLKQGNDTKYPRRESRCWQQKREVAALADSVSIAKRRYLGDLASYYEVLEAQH